MIVLFTDFGLAGPYVGQMIAALHAEAPGMPVISLFADAPAQEPELSAYLLAAYVQDFPPDSVFLAVVDPGVGGSRRPLAVRAGGRWFVGPDNGLFAILARRADAIGCGEINWRPERRSASFHGRDLFAPVAALLARGEAPPGDALTADVVLRAGWPDDLARIVYIDHFGNAMTGLRATTLGAETVLAVGVTRLVQAGTFSEVPPGHAFWYENANGLAEIAVNRGRADARLGLALGQAISVED